MPATGTVDNTAANKAEKCREERGNVACRDGESNGTKVTNNFCAQTREVGVEGCYRVL